MLLFLQVVPMSANKPESKSAVSADKKQPDKPEKKSEPKKEASQEKKPKESQSTTDLKLSGLYAFKLGMTSIYGDKGVFIPVTVLQFRPWLVSQVKTRDKEGYCSVQLACRPQKNKRCSKSISSHLSAAGFKEGAAYVREVRQDSSADIKVGQSVSIHSLQRGDVVTLSGISKGCGFAGVVKRWGFKGGPASHGAKTHRTSGSIGNRTEPGRVMPGKKMPGHKGARRVSLRNVKVLNVVEDKQLVIVKGAVPGARNSLVYLHKTEAARSVTG